MLSVKDRGGARGEELGATGRKDGRFRLSKASRKESRISSRPCSLLSEADSCDGGMPTLTFPGRRLLLLEKGANLTSTFNSALPLYCRPLTCRGPNTEQASFKSPISTYELPEAEGTRLVCKKMGRSCENDR